MQPTSEAKINLKSVELIVSLQCDTCGQTTEYIPVTGKGNIEVLEQCDFCGQLYTLNADIEVGIDDA